MFGGGGGGWAADGRRRGSGRGAGGTALRRDPARAAGGRRPPPQGGARPRRAGRRLHPAADGARVEEADAHLPAHGVPGHVRTGRLPGGHDRLVHPARSEPGLLCHQPRADAAPLRLRRRRGDGRAVPGGHHRFGQRAVWAGTGDGSPRLVGHERPAHKGVPPPAAALAGLLHRGEGRRRHEPHDQRHREPAAAAAGRAGPVRHSGPDHDRHHGLPLRHQREAGCHHRLRGAASPRHHVDLVQAGLRARLRQGARRHRARCWPTSPRACRACASSRRTTVSATTSRPTATSSAPTGTPTTTRVASTASTDRGRRSSASSASCSSWASAARCTCTTPRRSTWAS